MATETSLVLGQPIEFKDLSAEFARIKYARESEGLIQTARASLLIILRPECMDRTVDEIEKMVARRELWHPDPAIKRLTLKRKTLSTGMKDGGGRGAQVLQIAEFEVDDLCSVHDFRVLPETYHVLENLQISSHDASKIVISLKMPDDSRPKLVEFVCNALTRGRTIIQAAEKLLGWSPCISLPEGGYLRDSHTLEELGIESGDVFWVYQIQVGGMYHPTSGMDDLEPIASPNAPPRMDDLEPIASPHAPPAAVQGPKHSEVIVELLEEQPSGTGGGACAGRAGDRAGNDDSGRSAGDDGGAKRRWWRRSRGGEQEVEARRVASRCCRWSGRGGARGAPAAARRQAVVDQGGGVWGAGRRLLGSIPAPLVKLAALALFRV